MGLWMANWNLWEKNPGKRRHSCLNLTIWRLLGISTHLNVLWAINRTNYEKQFTSVPMDWKAKCIIGILNALLLLRLWEVKVLICFLLHSTSVRYQVIQWMMIQLRYLGQRLSRHPPTIFWCQGPVQGKQLIRRRVVGWPPQNIQWQVYNISSQAFFFNLPSLASRTFEL